MANLQSITGEDIIRAIRKKSRRGIVWCIVGIIAAFAFMVGGLMMIRKAGQIFYGVIMMVAAAGGAYAAFYYISVMNKKLADTENCDLFRKFGTPDTIAQRIAEECSEPVLEAKGVLICDSFIMRKNDFESYIPFAETLAVFRREHRTNGIPDGVYLVLKDSYGNEQQYPFKFGKTGKEMMTQIMEHISQKAPKCAFGYTPEVLSYVRQNQKSLDK